MITKWYETFGKPAAAVVSQQPKVSAASYVALNTPLKIGVKEAHYPKNHEGVVAAPDDQIIVYAWAGNYTEAIAYNTRNKTTGRIPKDLLDMTKTEAVQVDRLYMVTSDEQPASLDHVTWKAGDYIRVWDRKDGSYPRCTGLCFNLASGKIGQFSTMYYSLKPVD
jgi:hypothetical protein